MTIITHGLSIYIQMVKCRFIWTCVCSPKNSSGNLEDCAVQSSGTGWEDWSCSSVPSSSSLEHTVAPVCQHDTSITSTTRAQPETAAQSETLSQLEALLAHPERFLALQQEAAEVSCPASWSIKYNGHCYMIYRALVTWMTAEFNCIAEGGRLASIHSPAEEQFLRQLSGGSSYWVGGYLHSGGGSKVWSDGSAWDYEDIYHGKDGCLVYTHRYSWRTVNCHSTSYTFNYICKIW